MGRREHPYGREGCIRQVVEGDQGSEEGRPDLEKLAEMARKHSSEAF